MLSPDDRRLYTDALRPPPGFRFAEAVATTYSLDLQTLLAIPLHLALFSAEQPLGELLKDGVALLEALRRTADQLTVYAQASRVLAPGQPHVLYGLLEPCVVEARPPQPDAAFHPKLWLIRFQGARREDVRLRLLVLTRNLTDDRCWDLVLTLEGAPGEEPREDNRGLHRLLESLSSLAVRAADPERVARGQALAELALRTEWQPPDGFDRVRFHALGLDGPAPWTLDPCGKLAVISPFVTGPALRALARSTKHPVALVSRPEELERVDPDALDLFPRVLTLAREAELEDGEEGAEARDVGLPAVGLHAKAFVVERGWDTHLYVGSANATSAALLGGRNVEVLAELVGRRSRVGAVEDLLDGDGLGALLTDWTPPDEPEAPDAELERARAALEACRRRMVDAGLRLRFSPGGEEWSVTLSAERPLPMVGVDAARAWLVTRRAETSASLSDLKAGADVELPAGPLSLLTSFVAFELTSHLADESVRFVLSLHADGLPVEERDAAIVRDVIRNRDGFLRYVVLLLAEAGEDAGVFGASTGSWNRFGRPVGDDDEIPLFETLTRAFCREPERLTSVRRLLAEIGSDDGEVVPPAFLELWDVFQEARREQDGAPAQ